MKSVTAVAPINIALIKYWGKSDDIEVLPYNPSISLSMADLYTKTTLKKGDQPGLYFYLDDVLQNDVEHQKINVFLRRFKGFHQAKSLVVESYNHVPTAAGFASSASGFAALAVAANAFFGTNYTLDELVKITKQGSGSATRSLLGGAVLWETSGHIKKLDATLDDYEMIFVVIDDQKKFMSSRKAMAHTVKTSSLYEYWVKKAEADSKDMIQALKSNHFHIIGTIMEDNAKLMHATMLCADPPLTYINQASLKVWDLVHQARKNGLIGYATMDAGPNVKILIRQSDTQSMIKHLAAYGFNRYYLSRIDFKGAVLLHEHTDI
ncbi:MAG: diphosphomevalonate decarboxylase [Acholeplasmataceae bacterium]